MAGETGHVVSLIVRITVFVSLFGTIKFINKKKEIFFFKLLTVDQRRLANS